MKTIPKAAEGRSVPALLLSLFLLGVPGAVRAHAYPEHADPKVGAAIASSPRQVRIWFDTELEPASSSIAVLGSDGAPVDDGDGRVDPSNAKLLAVHVPPLAPGAYRVTWSVSGHDGHPTSGDYTFTVK